MESDHPKCSVTFSKIYTYVYIYIYVYICIYVYLCIYHRTLKLRGSP